MHKTHIDLSANIRKEVIGVLEQLVADTSDSYSQIKQAHWTVKGPNFIQFHELFDKVAADVLGHVDVLAERVQQLGGDIKGTVRDTANNSSMKEYPKNIKDGIDHAAAVSELLGALAKKTRKAIDTTDEAGDAISADILTQITGNLDKNLWFVEAHLQAKE